MLGQPCTTKSDIFSLGVLLYELVTLEVPQRGNLRDPAVPLECPQEVADAITACMQVTGRSFPPPVLGACYSDLCKDLGGAAGGFWKELHGCQARLHNLHCSPAGHAPLQLELGA